MVLHQIFYCWSTVLIISCEHSNEGAKLLPLFVVVIIILCGNHFHELNSFQRSIKICTQFFLFKGPPPAFAVAGCPSTLSTLDTNSCHSPLDSIFDGILLAVPKFRRSIEKRLHRKHRFTGFMEHGTPKSNIIPCLECGNFKEKGYLCSKWTE